MSFGAAAFTRFAGEGRVRESGGLFRYPGAAP